MPEFVSELLVKLVVGAAALALFVAVLVVWSLLAAILQVLFRLSEHSAAIGAAGLGGAITGTSIAAAFDLTPFLYVLLFLAGGVICTIAAAMNADACFGKQSGGSDGPQVDHRRMSRPTLQNPLKPGITNPLKGPPPPGPDSDITGPNRSI